MSEDKELQKLNTIENTEIDADDDDIEDAEDTIGDRQQCQLRWQNCDCRSAEHRVGKE